MDEVDSSPGVHKNHTPPLILSLKVQTQVLGLEGVACGHSSHLSSERLLNPWTICPGHVETDLVLIPVSKLKGDVVYRDLYHRGPSRLYRSFPRTVLKYKV